MPKKRPVVVDDDAAGSEERPKRLALDELEALTAFALKMVLGGRSVAPPAKRGPGGTHEN